MTAALPLPHGLRFPVGADVGPKSDVPTLREFEHRNEPFTQELLHLRAVNCSVEVLG